MKSGIDSMTEKRYKRHLSFVLDDYANGSDRLMTIREVIPRLNELYDENEQLKATIKKVTELLSDEVDLFSEKATEHDIIAYEELRELDNKDAFYMATATKEAIKILKRCLND